MSTITLAGEVKGVRYHAPATGFFVLNIQMGGEWFGTQLAEDIVAVGTSDVLPPVDTLVELVGSWRKHQKYGRQFSVVEIHYPEESGAIYALLASGFLDYVKAEMAKRLVEQFGGGVFNILDEAVKENNPGLITVVKGIGPVTGPRILESWCEQRGWAYSAVNCVRAGMTLHMARKCRTVFGDALQRVILEWPYRLTIVDGISWHKADAIAKMAWPGKTPIGHDDPQRYAAGMREILKRGHGAGHMCLPKDDAVAETCKLVKPSPGHDLLAEVEPAYREENIREWEDYLYYEPLYQLERSVAALAQSLAAADVGKAVSLRFPDDGPIVLTANQKKAINTALNNPVSIITGGPGTGKTTTIRMLVEMLDKLGMTYILMAPTGKAADRMAEATKREAWTVHRALGIKSEGHRSVLKLTAACAVVDECSMMDTSLARHLLSALDEGQHLVLIGDVDQLPPVGAGEPLVQLIRAGLPTTKLEYVHRQREGSEIIAAAHQVNRGQTPTSGDLDFFLATVGSNDRLPEVMFDVLPRAKVKWGADLTEIQVLTSVNKWPWGQFELNLKLQALLNPGKNLLAGVIYREGDRVIHLKNNYNLGVFNGMVGEVIKVLTPVEEEEWLEYIEEKRLKDAHGNPMEPPVVTVRYREGDEVEYGRTLLKEELALAYALTIHKSQGSEFDYVFLLVPSSYRGFMMRQLVYTGITRAKKRCLMIAVPWALEAHVTNEARVRRYTNIAKMMMA